MTTTESIVRFALDLPILVQYGMVVLFACGLHTYFRPRYF